MNTLHVPANLSLRPHRAAAALAALALIGIACLPTQRKAAAPSNLPSAWREYATAIHSSAGEPRGLIDHAFRFVRRTKGARGDSLLEWEWKARVRHTQGTETFGGWLVYVLRDRQGAEVARDSMTTPMLRPGDDKHLRQSAWMLPELAGRVHRADWHFCCGEAERKLRCVDLPAGGR